MKKGLYVLLISFLVGSGFLFVQEKRSSDASLANIIIAGNDSTKAIGQTWVRVLTPMTCEQTCSSVGSKLLVDKCYGRDAKKTPKLCTMSKDGYCIDYDSSKITDMHSDMECCCEGTDFKGCTSTDGGDPFVKGTANDGRGHTATDACAGGNELVSYKCSSWGNTQFMPNFVCPKGCKDGACIKDQPKSTCTDTDGGKDYFVAGRVNTVNKIRDTIDSGAYFDVCSNNVLKEMYCASATNSRALSENYNCPNGCKDGACVKEQPKPTCTDSDGGKDYFVKGTAQDSTSPILLTDVCEKNGQLAEMSCDGTGRVVTELHACPNGCKNGACVKEQPKSTCTDSDGGQDLNIKGTTIGKWSGEQGSYVDYCKDDSELAEYFCEDSPTPHVVLQDNVCPNGCQDGICAPEPSEKDLDQIENQMQIQELLTGIGGMSGMLSDVKLMEKTFQQIVKNGIAMPSELEESILRVKEISPEIMKLQNRKVDDITDDEIFTLMDNLSELCEIGPTLQEWSDQIPSFLQLGVKMNQLSKDLKKATSDVKLAVKAATRSKFGLSDKGDELNSAIEALKGMKDESIAITDFDEKDGKINEFYDQFQDIYDTIGVINALQNTAKAKVEWGKRVKANASTINKLQNAESDVSELVAKNDEVKTKVDELNLALVKKPMDRDEIKWIFEDLKSRQAEFVDIADQLRGVKSALPKVQAVKFDPSQFKNFDAFSPFCGVSLETNNEEEVPEESEY